MCQHLSFIGFGKATGGKAKVRTGLGKSDCPGSQGGLWKRVKKRAPYFYPDVGWVTVALGSEFSMSGLRIRGYRGVAAGRTRLA